MIVNIALLKGKMKEHEVTQEMLADGIKIDRSTLNRKLSQEGLKFTVHEANAIVDYLCLPVEDAMKIFFAEKIADKRHE